MVTIVHLSLRLRCTKNVDLRPWSSHNGLTILYGFNFLVQILKIKLKLGKKCWILLKQTNKLEREQDFQVWNPSLGPLMPNTLVPCVGVDPAEMNPPERGPWELTFCLILVTSLEKIRSSRRSVILSLTQSFLQS